MQRESASGEKQMENLKEEALRKKNCENVQEEIHEKIQ